MTVRLRDFCFAGDVIFIDIDHEDVRLEGEELIAADDRLLIGGQLQDAQRLDIFQRRFEFFQQVIFSDILIGFMYADFSFQRMHAILDDGKIAEDELFLH